jgi:hypothetical protein
MVARLCWLVHSNKRRRYSRVFVRCVAVFVALPPTEVDLPQICGAGVVRQTKYMGLIVATARAANLSLKLYLCGRSRFADRAKGWLCSGGLQ